MTDELLESIFRDYQKIGHVARVLVTASDYSYEGHLVAVFTKRRKSQVRCVVEDANGRLFIHNAGQLIAL